ncbi:MAG: hypothetical protein AAB481_02980 [Patescibacteria group bacterium]
MKTICGKTHLIHTLWSCDRPAIASIDVVWKSGEQSARIDFPHCASHEADAEGKALKLEEDLRREQNYSEVHIEKPIIGEAREVGNSRLSAGEARLR